MISASEGRGDGQTRTYDRANSVVFSKTNELFGGLSNMAGGFPLCVNGIRILTSEALYQSCRFPRLPDVQRLLIEQASPMTAKMKSKQHGRDSRPDWNRVRVRIMRWCLSVKLAQNWDAFSRLLLQTGDRPIVEESSKDAFWGAKPVGEHILVGMSVLGRLLLELRDVVRTKGRVSFLHVEPIDLPDFLLDGRPIEPISVPDSAVAGPHAKPAEHPSRGDAVMSVAVQASLFDPPGAQETASTRYGSKNAKGAGIAGLKPYPAMKDSGAPWLGEVPEHWEVRRLKAAVAQINEQTAERQPGDAYMALEHVESWTGRVRLPGSDVAFDSQVKRFQRNDVLFGKLRPYLAKVARLSVGGVCVGEFLVLRTRSGSVLPAFLENTLRSKPVIDAIDSSTFGAKMPRADWGFIGGLFLGFPTASEQSAIVRFLGHVDRRIRRYIRAKQQLIELLEEQKQAIIHRAVTRGLDPNVRLKPSGVEWLGEVPEHWVVRRVKTLCSMRSGDGITAMAIEPAGDYPVFGGNGLRGYASSYTHDGDFVLIGRQGALCGNVHIAHGRFWASEHAVVASVRPGYVLDWFGVMLEVMNLNQYSIAAAQPGLAVERVLSRWLPVPPAQEQARIAEHVKHGTAEITKAVDRAQRGIALVREYRTRLIADVVTGKLDVREAAARLPDEGVGPEPLDEADVVSDAEEEPADEFDAVPEEAAT
jgi:type I restriction enzyme S subunit